jgi:hypothetical protein
VDGEGATVPFLAAFLDEERDVGAWVWVLGGGGVQHKRGDHGALVAELLERRGGGVLWQGRQKFHALGYRGGEHDRRGLEAPVLLGEETHLVVHQGEALNTDLGGDVEAVGEAFGEGANSPGGEPGRGRLRRGGGEHEALFFEHLHPAYEARVGAVEEGRAVLDDQTIAQAVHQASPRGDGFFKDLNGDPCIGEGAGAGQAREASADDEHPALLVGPGDGRRGVASGGQAPGVDGGGAAADAAHLAGGLVRTVKEAKTPEDAAVAGGIPAVEGIAMVELLGHGEGPGRVLDPGDDLLAPGHAHVVVEPTVAAEASLGGVPERVAGLPSIEGVQGRREEGRDPAAQLVESPPGYALEALVSRCMEAP